MAKKSVLLVEDNPADAELVSELIGNSPGEFVIDRATRLHEAVKKLSERDFDVILLDLRLPDGSELECVETVRRASANTPLVVLTGLEDRDLGALCLEAGAEDYIEKEQLSTSMLRRAVEYAIARARAKDLRRRLEHSDRLATIGQLAAGVAHEINNPATFVRLNLGVMLKAAQRLGAMVESGQISPRGEARGELLELVDELNRLGAENQVGIDRIVSIVKNLGEFARSTEDRAEWVDLKEVCHIAYKIVFNEVRHRAEFVLDLEDVPRIFADPGKLEQVVVNLLVNAAQAIKKGPVADNEVRLQLRGSPDRIVLSVLDTGCGIPERDRKRIFEPFFTTKQRTEGTGLGLTVTADIVTSLGGQIGVESEPGRGARFDVTLPLAEKSPELAIDQSRREDAIDQAKRRPTRWRARVLVIDDEAVLVLALKRLLTERYDVVVATSGRAAIGILAQDPFFDVILCDLMMPDLDGPGVYEAVRDREPGLLRKFVFLSGGAFTDRASEFVRSHDVMVVKKPVSIDCLASVIDSLAL